MRGTEAVSQPARAGEAQTGRHLPLLAVPWRFCSAVAAAFSEPWCPILARLSSSIAGAKERRGEEASPGLALVPALKDPRRKKLTTPVNGPAPEAAPPQPAHPARAAGESDHLVAGNQIRSVITGVFSECAVAHLGVVRGAKRRGGRGLAKRKETPELERSTQRRNAPFGPVGRRRARRGGPLNAVA
jgi:hypothetical protein